MDNTLPTSKTILIPDVLLSYAYLAQPYTPRTKAGDKPAKPQFTVHGIFARGSAAEQLITATIVEICKNAWGEAPMDQAVVQPDQSTKVVSMPAWRAMLTQFKNEQKLPMRDGNRRKPIAEPYKDNLFIAANNPSRPRILVTRGGTNVEIGPDDPQFPYSGCRANISVDVWAQGTPKKPSEFGSRINAQLAGVQFLAHGKKLGGGGRIAQLDEFGICPADADAPPPGVAAEESESLV
jgi:hypothetical protein